MPTVVIDGYVSFSSNNGVYVHPDAVNLTPEHLHHLISKAFLHINDELLRNACHGGIGALAAYSTLTLEEYLEICEQEEINRQTLLAKRELTAVRRAEFGSNRAALALEMIDSGIAYSCAKAGCGESTNLTIDHKKPLSKGGTDDLSNLQFLCRKHNSAKGDREVINEQD